MKEIKLKLLSELMKNSKVSDRELARKLNVSQPTVSRIRARLEKEGYIQEYAALPDFTKLGFEIMALSFVKLKHVLSKEETNKIRKFADELQQRAPIAMLMAAEGIGCDADRVVITLHPSYTAYSEFVKTAKENPMAELYSFDSFIISLSLKTHYQPLTLRKIAEYILTMKDKPT